MDDLQFYIFSTVFQSYQDDARRTCDNKRLCAMKIILPLKISPPQSGLNPGATTSVASTKPTELLVGTSIARMANSIDPDQTSLIGAV